MYLAKRRGETQAAEWRGREKKGKKENSVKWCFTSSTKSPTQRISRPANEEDSGKSGELSQGSCRKSGKGGQKCMCAPPHSHMYAHVHSHTHSHFPTLTHTHSHTCTPHTITCPHTCSYTHAHICTHSHPHSHAHSRADKQKELGEKTDSSRNHPRKSPLVSNFPRSGASGSQGEAVAVRGSAQLRKTPQGAATCGEHQGLTSMSSTAPSRRAWELNLAQDLVPPPLTPTYTPPTLISFPLGGGHLDQPSKPSKLLLCFPKLLVPSPGLQWKTLLPQHLAM